MIKNDRVYGVPLTQYKDTKSNIEALSGIPEGAIAYATDSNEFGSYDGTTWTWGQGGSGAGGPFQRNLSADLALSDGQCLVITGYIDLASYSITLNGDAVLEIL